MAQDGVPYKFPRTPHLLNLGAATDDDMVCSDSDLNLWLKDRCVIVGEPKGVPSSLCKHGYVYKGLLTSEVDYAAERGWQVKPLASQHT